MPLNYVTGWCHIMYINILYSIGWKANVVEFYYLKVFDSIPESYSDEI